MGNGLRVPRYLLESSRCAAPDLRNCCSLHRWMLPATTEVRERPILLKKSVTAVLIRFSWVALPLADARERFVGRSERSNFSLAMLARRATTFSTESTHCRRSTLQGSGDGSPRCNGRSVGHIGWPSAPSRTRCAADGRLRKKFETIVNIRPYGNVVWNVRGD